MNEVKERIGNFTSSNIYKLCGGTDKPTAPFYTYVQEKMFERKLNRSIEMGARSQSMTWGKLLEKRVFDNLPLGYVMTNKSTKRHKDFPHLVGTTDFLFPDVKVSELKCFEPKNFASYVSVLLAGDTEIIKKEHPKEYWQIISNSIINEVPKGEAIAYMPYESEMEEIRGLMQDEEYLAKVDLTIRDVFYIHEKPNSELAVLPNDSKFPNLNIFEFEVPELDKEFLLRRVALAESLIK